MKAGLSVSLGFLFVGLAMFNVITMLHSVTPPARISRRPAMIAVALILVGMLLAATAANYWITHVA